MTAMKNNDQYYVHIFKDSNKNNAYLPSSIIKGKKCKRREYKIICYDDKINVFYNDKEETSLESWFENIDK